MPTAMGPSTEVSQLNSWLVGVVVSMATLSTAFVVLRLVSRRMRQQKLWWDDWTILVSMVREDSPIFPGHACMHTV